MCISHCSFNLCTFEGNLTKTWLNRASKARHVITSVTALPTLRRVVNTELMRGSNHNCFGAVLNYALVTPSPRIRDRMSDEFHCFYSFFTAEPIRPQEIKLPAEILYKASDCSNSSYLRTIEIKFQAAVQAALRVSETGVCATNPGDCIVDEVNSRCRDISDTNIGRFRRHSTGFGHRRYRGAALLYSSDVADRRLGRYERGLRYPGDEAARRRGRSRRGVQYVLPVLFHFGTRVPETSGDWPDEYHNALRRLYGMFDTFETQVLAGSFSITHKVRDLYVEELRNSLAYHTEIAICDIGYQFKSSIKLCGKYSSCSAAMMASCPLLKLYSVSLYFPAFRLSSRAACGKSFFLKFALAWQNHVVFVLSAYWAAYCFRVSVNRSVSTKALALTIWTGCSIQTKPRSCSCKPELVTQCTRVAAGCHMLLLLLLLLLQTRKYNNNEYVWSDNFKAFR